MNKMNFRKASAVCLALTMSCLQVQPLTSLPVLAEEEVILSEDESETEAANEPDEEEDSEEESPDEEEVVLEETEEESDSVTDEKPAEDKEAETDSLDTEYAMIGSSGLKGSPSEKISTLKQMYPEGEQLQGRTDFSYAEHCFDLMWRPGNINRYLHKKPVSVSDIKPGDFVQVYTSDKTPKALIVESVDKTKNTIQGTTLDTFTNTITWRAVFDFRSVDYFISPDNPVINCSPGKGVDASLYDSAEIFGSLKKAVGYSRSKI